MDPFFAMQGGAFALEDWNDSFWWNRPGKISPYPR